MPGITMCLRRPGAERGRLMRRWQAGIVLQLAIQLLLAACSGKPAPAAVQAEPGDRVVVLGTGTPNADPLRSGPALAVIAQGKVYLVDAGPGVVRRAAAAHEAGVAELTMPAL